MSDNHIACNRVIDHLVAHLVAERVKAATAHLEERLALAEGALSDAQARADRAEARTAKDADFIAALDRTGDALVTAVRPIMMNTASREIANGIADALNTYAQQRRLLSAGASS